MPNSFLSVLVSLNILLFLYDPGPGYSILTLDSSQYFYPNVYLGTLGRLFSTFLSGLYAPGPGFLLITSDFGVCFTILVLGPSPMHVFSTYFPGPTSALSLDSSLHLNFGFLLKVLDKVLGLYLSIS